MSGTAAPVTAGLAVGVVFIVVMAVAMPSANSLAIPSQSSIREKITLKEEWDKQEQERALEILLHYPDVRKDLQGRNLEVWALNPNLGDSGPMSGYDCHSNSCTIIGLRDTSRGGSIIALVNIESNRLYGINYSGGWLQ